MSFTAGRRHDAEHRPCCLEGIALIRILVIVGVMASAWGGTATATVLYDGALGTAPETQGWLAFGELGGTASRVTAGGATTFSTTSNSTIQAGYSNYAGLTLVNPAFPQLDRVAGYTVTLDMQVLSESHASANRSGVSLLVLSDDLLGIEVAFWEDEVWVQSGPDFLHAEGASFDTTAAMTRYDLTILGGGYSITADGNPLLVGSLRDYSSFGFPYSLSNYLFLGDNTTSASGSFEVEQLAVVPEPSIGLVTTVCALALLRLREQRRKGLAARMGEGKPTLAHEA